MTVADFIVNDHERFIQTAVSLVTHVGALIV